MVNDELILDVIAQIERTPEKWNQSVYTNECGTQFCFAGWALELSPNVTWHRSEMFVEVDGEPKVPSFAADGLLGVSGWVAPPRIAETEFSPDVAEAGQRWYLYDAHNTRDDLYRIAAEWMGMDEQVVRDKVRERI